MKRLILLCFCLGNYFFGAAQLYESVRTDLSTLKIQKGEEFDNIRLDNSELLEIPGQPNLPVYIESFVVPIDADVTGVKVNKVTKHKLSGTYRIEPAQQPIPPLAQACGLCAALEKQRLNNVAFQARHRAQLCASQPAKQSKLINHTIKEINS